MIISFLVFVFALCLVLGAYLLATHGTDKKRARLQKRLHEALLHSAHTEDIDVLLARHELMSEIPWINRTLINIQATLHLKRMLDQAHLHITPSRLIMFSVMAGLLGALAASVLTVFIPLMILGGFVCASLPFLHVYWRRKKRFDQPRAQCRACILRGSVHGFAGNARSDRDRVSQSL
jgi:Flp pilus assembly protein TadB